MHVVDLLSLLVVALLPCLDFKLSLLEEAVDRMQDHSGHFGYDVARFHEQANQDLDEGFHGDSTGTVGACRTCCGDTLLQELLQTKVAFFWRCSLVVAVKPLTISLIRVPIRSCFGSPSSARACTNTVRIFPLALLVGLNESLRRNACIELARVAACWKRLTASAG